MFYFLWLPAFNGVAKVFEFYPSLIVNCADMPHDKDESFKKDYLDNFCNINWDLI